ncbi:MAG: T9SS type A sorting domain-containing protein [Saprospiraceae bacterium]|mgnify:FL=1|nr:T9SS type A sorting domain-containing protein [Saprospiraceae bacterium]MBX7179314.1 T9SS type A sorting domain-containing protein [Saprospiraceae bacterium]MCB0591521.1 T9SS type A sorting domain-containing protein [Saprospiraceae bacterium]MCO5282179.1 T9SS type A sorting domain-containing protein [Saprospiraceae bacterium]MCO6471603.1 T9SS type A sorting domain-containing protein [Saprospiraceae bacterium]
MKSKIFILILIIANSVFAQNTINIRVDASAETKPMPPIWRDHYENHLSDGYGGNPAITGNHTLYTTDPSFYTIMKELQPRYIRISIGRIDNPPSVDYSSMNTHTLRNLKYEFYKGGNSTEEANNITNYDFSYIDSAISLIHSFGAEPFITMDYMPFNLSRDTTPEYQGLMGLIYNLAYDNSIRNSPPSDNAVYGRVMYHFIKHCYQKYGVKYFEHWNEPDQQWLNPIMAKFFWRGDEQDLYKAYAAIANEVSSDQSLSPNVKLGGCSFAFYSFLNLMPQNFLTNVQTNGTKFDFLSFHPYSDNQFMGGYDTAKVNLAIQWRNTYVPHAELINAEWGRLEPNSPVWGDLDYGLDKFRHIVDMLDKGISMSHETCLFDGDITTDNFANLGMFRVGPIVPKPSAYVFYNLNRLNDALNRLPVAIDNGGAVLAARSDNGDKILIALPADNPTNGSNAINLTVDNLPWENTGYYLNRYELTEQSYFDGIIFNLTHTRSGAGNTVSDSLSYPSIQNSGRLVLWEISSTPLTVKDLYPEHVILSIYPNPNQGSFSVRSLHENITMKSLTIYTLTGQEVLRKSFPYFQNQININDFIGVGTFIVVIETNRGTYTSRFIAH